MTAPSDHDLTVMVEAAARALHGALASAKAPAWESEDDSWRRRMTGLADKAVTAVLAKLPELGWVKQRTITTVEGLSGMPFRTVILDANGYGLQKLDGYPFNDRTGKEYWWRPADGDDDAAEDDSEVNLPVIVLFEPEPTR